MQTRVSILLVWLSGTLVGLNQIRKSASLAALPAFEVNNASAWELPSATSTRKVGNGRSLLDIKHSSSWRQENSTIPPWMANYLDWHAETRRKITPENWKEYKFAIVSCLEHDFRCGGASDRLQSLPWDLLFSARAKRILLHKWERPCKLEEFLVPNEIDWSTPDWLWDAMIESDPNPMVLSSSKSRYTGPAFAHQGNLIRLKLQTSDHGAHFYNQQVLEMGHSTDPNVNANRDGNTTHVQPLFWALFRDAWNAFFQPAAPVQKLIDETLTDLGLQSRQYIAAHVRQKYHKDKSHDLGTVENHIRCTYRQRPKLPIYFASDSIEATTHAVAFGQSQRELQKDREIRVVARTNTTEPLHLDRGADFLTNSNAWKNTTAPQYYDVFVDLYMLAQAQCVVYAVGGYGQWASLLTTEPCSYRQKKEQCKWDDPPRS